MVIVMTRLVHGVGINDAEYQVRSRMSEGSALCPFYRVWADMLRRCYDKKYHERQPTYTNCSVCDEWLTFSNFKLWMEKQDWQGKQLDKDIIQRGNKVYSPELCAFVDRSTNNFPEDSAAIRGRWPIGVCFNKNAGKFAAECGNPITKKKEYLGLFNCEHKAHLAWKKRKHEIACQLAEMQTDERVASALRIRYA